MHFEMKTYDSEFPSKNEMLKFIFTKHCNYRRKVTSLKNKMQKTELTKLYFSLKHLQSTKRQDKFKIPFRNENL